MMELSTGSVLQEQQQQMQPPAGDISQLQGVHDTKILVGRLLQVQGSSGTNGQHTSSSSAAALISQDQAPEQGSNKNASGRPSKSSSKVVNYRECMKNHAASIGGHALDGCGEFLPSGEEGSIEALRCAACDCHRNFHKREVEGEPLICDICHLNRRERNRKAAAIAAGVGSGNNNSNAAAGVAPKQLLALGGGESQQQNLNLIDQQHQQQQVGAMLHGAGSSSMMMKKRFRTKFSMDQKERMFLFADKLGWRIQKQDEAVVQQFCAEVGVKRHVLKVWMHNNKHTFAKRSSSSSPGPAALQAPPASGTMNLVGAPQPLHFNLSSSQPQQQQQQQQQQQIPAQMS